MTGFHLSPQERHVLFCLRGLIWIALLFMVALNFFSRSGAEAASLYVPHDSISLERNRELNAVLRLLHRQHGTIIAMQRELVALPAVNPEHGGTGEESKLRWVEARLREQGIADFERLDYVDSRVPGKMRGNLIARLPGQSDDSTHRRTLWLVSHLDVFPPGPADQWKGDPFTLRVEGDLMYGRGTEDNNQSIVTSLLLVETFRAAQIVPKMDIGLLFCSGALTNYEMNIEYVLERRPGLFSPEDLVLVMDYGSESGDIIEVAEKGNIWLKFTVTGMEGHAGSPQESVNALAVGAEFIHALRGFDEIFPARNSLFVPSGSTFTPTLAENHSRAINHIPGEFVFYVDARLIPEYGFDDLEKAVRDLATAVGERENARIGFEVVEQTAVTAATPADARVVLLLGRAIKAQLGVEPKLVGIGGVTMASAIRERGFSVAVWGIQKNWRNKAEEHASIANHIKQAKVLARLLFDPETAGTARTEEGERGDKP